MPYLGNVPAENYAQVSYQDLTGGSGTSFTLDYPVGSAGEIEVFVNNVRQEPTVAYTVNGTALTMTGSIAATDDFYIVFQGKAEKSGTIPEKQTDGTYVFPDDVTVSGNITSTGIDDNATSTAMTLDSSGNAIIGGTSAGQDGAVTLSNTGYIQARIDNDTVAYFDRTGAGDDGEVIRIQQNGSTVGVIGTVASEVYIGNGDTGLYFASGNNDIRPFNTSTQNSVDNSIDLGRSATRFKDLYLSGGVYIGGTGSANHLDDYEEGTFTPTLEGTSGDPTVSYVAQKGSYVKVGRVVHCTVQLQTSSRSGGAGNCRVGGFPFTCNQSTVGWQSGSVAYTNNFTSAPTRVMMQNGLNSANLYTCDSTSNPRADHSTGFGTSLWANAGDLYFAISYETNS